MTLRESINLTDDLRIRSLQIEIDFKIVWSLIMVRDHLRIQFNLSLTKLEIYRNAGGYNPMTSDCNEKWPIF